MPRQPRIEYAGAIYHVMSRGNRGCVIFRDDADREMFLETLSQACFKTGWLIHAYVLMNTHFHILLETPEANLVLGMQWFQSTYTQRFNVRHREFGHLFQGRYKALLIDPDSETYFTVVSSYVHLNPARARLFDLCEGSLTDYKWSSYLHYLRPSKRPDWLCVNKVFSCLRFSDDSKGRRSYRRFMQSRVTEMAGHDKPYAFDEDWSKIRHGWCLGEASFRGRLLDYIEKIRQGKKVTSLGGEGIRSHNERQAEKLLSRGIRILGLTESSLEAMRKSAQEKQVLAWLLRSRTTVSNEWVSSHLLCGHPDGVSRYVKTVEMTKDKVMLALKKKVLKHI